MSICQSGMECNIKPGKISVGIEEHHPLLGLANVIEWKELAEMVLPDLKSTTKGGQWWRGRKLKLRIHLGTFLLQQLFNKTDRQMEYDLKDNAAYQLFSGKLIVHKWHAPDHTKIEEFRSRLSPETQKKLANHIAVNAVKLGFGDPSDVDIDSTVQEANMAYPADSCLLKKLGSMCNKVANYCNEKVRKYVKEPLSINYKKISQKARKYFFLPKNSTKEIKDDYLQSLLDVVSEEVKPAISACQKISDYYIKSMPWNIVRTINRIKELASQYLKDVQSFLTNGVMVPTKILSFHLSEISCFCKGKPGRKHAFGRAFQLCRIKGNFLIAGKNTSLQMPDKKSLEPLIQEHKKIFNADINSVATDKGYYSKKNEKMLFQEGVQEIGIQRPANIKSNSPQSLSKECQEKLINRRSGIEPLIGHAKHGGQLGRSRMKSDRTTESSGYSSILGFNLRQLIRHQAGKMDEILVT